MSKFSAIKHLTKEDIVKNGSIFTPKCLTDVVKKKCKPYITSDTTILDLGSGYGAFISAFRSFKTKIIGTDYDETSVQLLRQEFPPIPFHHENSLLNVCRSKYGIEDNDRLIVVGNPPYNDTTSAYRKGQKGELVCDEDLLSRDFGISFLKAYNKLKADYICVLHPLSYLIKQQNFRSLGDFRENYRLIDATVFSSKEFETIQVTNSDFPVVAALYERNADGMDYEHIREFKFSIFRSRKKFCLNQMETIDGIIPKYPKKNSANTIQFYTLRDINSLKRNTTFVHGPINNGVDVSVDNLYQYAWLMFFKENFNPPINAFLYGNLSPLYSKEIESNDIKNSLVTYAYSHNAIVRDKFELKELEGVYGRIVKTDDYSKLSTIIEKLYI